MFLPWGKNKMRKGIVIVIIGLFIGTSIVPSISGNFEEKQNLEKLNDSISGCIDQLDQYNHGYSNGSACSNINYPNRQKMLAQSFQPSLNKLTRVKLLFFNFNNFFI